MTNLRTVLILSCGQFDFIPFSPLKSHHRLKLSLFGPFYGHTARADRDHDRVRPTYECDVTLNTVYSVYLFI